MKFNTKLVHNYSYKNTKLGETITPIFQSSAFTHQSAEELENVFKGSQYGFIYTRINNPTVEAFERRVVALEGGLGGVACASGMSAITLAIMNIVNTGDEIISGSGIFGGTYSLFQNLKEFGIIAKQAKDNDISSFAELITDKTKLIFVETISNPKLEVVDIFKLSELAHKHNIPLIVDNTVTTPYIVNPIAYGADIVIHSTSKYINGSGNSIGGMIIDSGKFKWNLEKYPALQSFEKFGAFIYLAKLRKGLFKDFGSCLSPFNAYLNTLGLDTLGLRMDKIGQNAFQLAKKLNENPKIAYVNYPGLSEHKDHELAKGMFLNRFGGILTLRVGSKENAFKVINQLKYALNLANIGDVRTLVIHPASTIYISNTIEEKEAMGVYEDLIRISVGIEDVEDLISDFEDALSNI